MHQIYCVVFTHSFSDEVCDALFETAYLMLKNGSTRKKLRCEDGEGVVKTKFQCVAYNGTSGIVFDAHVETNKGALDVSYLVRPQELADFEDEEFCAWLSPEEFDDPPPEKRRPNPIYRAARSHRNN